MNPLVWFFPCWRSLIWFMSDFHVMVWRNKRERCARQWLSFTALTNLIPGINEYLLHWTLKNLAVFWLCIALLMFNNEIFQSFLEGSYFKIKIGWLILHCTPCLFFLLLVSSLSSIRELRAALEVFYFAFVNQALECSTSIINKKN